MGLWRRGSQYKNKLEKLEKLAEGMSDGVDEKLQDAKEQMEDLER